MEKASQEQRTSERSNRVLLFLFLMLFLNRPLASRRRHHHHHQHALPLVLSTLSTKQQLTLS